jgi:hypothetical protein
MSKIKFTWGMGYPMGIHLRLRVRLSAHAEGSTRENPRLERSRNAAANNFVHLLSDRNHSKNSLIRRSEPGIFSVTLTQQKLG